METKIVITNGSKVSGLLWVRHTGVDVYYGICGFRTKYSYHESGQFHETRDGKKWNVHHRSPLRSLQHFDQLCALTFRNARELFDGKNPLPTHSGKKKDIILSLDARALPVRSSVTIILGLMKPDDSTALSHLLGFRIDNLPPRQVMVSTGTDPWVCLAIFLEKKNSA